MLTVRPFAPLGRVARGFTMIEVLVTMVIMMFGLLGIAGLIIKGQKAGSEAYQRNQAMIIVMDMAEKMKTNRLPGGALNAASYKTGNGHGMPLGIAAIAVPTLCTAATCVPAAIVDYDVIIWNNLLVGTQETTGAVNNGGIINAQGCIEQPVAGGPVRISVAWQGDMDTGAGPPASMLCGGLFTTASYGTAGRIRVVAIDIL